MDFANLLLRLQQIDLELIRSHHDLDQVQQKEKLDQFRRAENKLAKNANKIKGVRKDLELDLGDNEWEQEHLEEIVVSVKEKFDSNPEDIKTAKEIQGQLTHLAKRIEKLNFEAQKMQEELKRAKLAEENVVKISSRLEEEKQQILSIVEEKSSIIQKHIDELEGERKEIIEELDPALVETYNKSSQEHSGLAVEKLNGNKPSICRVSLQAAQYADIKKQESEIVTCPYCKRMLVLDDLALEKNTKQNN